MFVVDETKTRVEQTCLDANKILIKFETWNGLFFNNVTSRFSNCLGHSAIHNIVFLYQFLPFYVSKRFLHHQSC